MKFPMSIQLAPFVSKDGYGDYTYGTSQTIPAVVDYTEENDQPNSIIRSAAWIALPPDAVVNIKDKITLPDGSTPYIGSISPVTNNRTGKIHYIEVCVSKNGSGGA